MARQGLMVDHEAAAEVQEAGAGFEQAEFFLAEQIAVAGLAVDVEAHDVGLAQHFFEGAALGVASGQNISHVGEDHALAEKMRRMSMMIWPRAISATERLLLCGSLKTAMPRRLHSARSIWSTPMQKAPMASSESAASSTSAEMRVLERIPRTLAPRSFCLRSSPLKAAAAVSTSNPAEASRNAATPEMFYRSS